MVTADDTSEANNPLIETTTHPTITTTVQPHHNGDMVI